MDTHRIARAFAAVTAMLALSACALGPNYKRPPVASPAVFRGEEGAAQQASIADLPWWEVFNDPALASLIRDASAGSLKTSHQGRSAIDACWAAPSSPRNTAGDATGGRL